MTNFPDFIMREANLVGKAQQNTEDVEGYYYTANDGSQAVLWTCRSEKISKEHRHYFDEYMLCISGQYTVISDGKETLLYPGDEIFIPAGTLQSGRCISGTRSLHVFGATRIK